MKTIEEIAARMPHATTFSVLDARARFWQLKLDNQSAKLCTFNTPFGRYMFKRLPFGISSAQDVFQAAMSDIFEDTEGVEVVVDDILVWGTTIEEHDTRLEQVLQRAQERNLKLNKDKSQIMLKEISYIGHILSHARWSQTRPKKSTSNHPVAGPHEQRRATAIPRYDNIPVKVHSQLLTNFSTIENIAREGI